MFREQKYKLKTRQGGTGFTVIELMLAIAILGVIIYALFSVFNQTQKALRRSETNTDVAQKARSVAEMIVGELEQAQPTMSFHLLDLGSLRIPISEINMLGGMEREYAPNNYVMNSSDPAILQRTNFIHNIFFYNNRTNGWQGIGYRVVEFTNGVGSLQRFETNVFGHRPISNVLSQAFVFTPLSTRVGLPEEIGRPNRAYRHIADGIVHLTFIPFDRNGRRLGWDTESHQDAIYTNDYVAARTRFNNSTNTFPNFMNLGTDVRAGTNGYNVLLQEGVPTSVGNPRLPNVPNIQYTTAFQFLTNAMPAYIEMEFGMLEPDTLAQYYTMLDDQNPNAAKFLQRQISKVHLFRQRITIRTASQ